LGAHLGAMKNAKGKLFARSYCLVMFYHLSDGWFFRGNPLGLPKKAYELRTFKSKKNKIRGFSGENLFRQIN